MDILVNWLKALHDADEIIEIRSIDPKPVISGYFRADSPNIQKELARYEGRTFYQTLNPVKQACYSRTQHEQLMPSPKETSSDNDIIGYKWILVDADPVRPSGVSATNAEKTAARAVATNVKAKLSTLGFCEPIVADSGNGYHLLYRIQANRQDKDAIASFLQVLDMWFSTEEAKIDTAVYNMARITKLYGTMTHKGASTPERPHRESRILVIPKVINKTPMDLVRHIAQEALKSTPATDNPLVHGKKQFQLDQFLAEHGVEVIRKIPVSSGVKYQLKECPFDSEHKDGDAAVFAYSNGSYGFHCFHNSCSYHHWHEFREKIDPQAYADTGYTFQKAVNPKEPQSNASRPRMLAFSEIPDLDRSKIEVIRSRFSSLDSKIGGFNKGELSVWSGSNSSGKSTLVGQLALAAVTEGYRVAMFSGELTVERTKDWLMLQCAGAKHVKKSNIDKVQYEATEYVKKKINEWIEDKIAIYDNDYGTAWEIVVDTIFNWVREKHADVIIIDNLMALELPLGEIDKYDMQSRIVKRFSAIAKQLNVHVHFICHPKKTEGFLRKGDISGSSDLTNAADNVFMVHRANADFMSLYKTIYKKVEIPNGVGNVIEIMKNRDLGIVDELIMLYFDKSCKLMSDVKGMWPQFAWGEQLEQLTSDGCTLLQGDEIPDDFPQEWRQG